MKKIINLLSISLIISVVFVETSFASFVDVTTKSLYYEAVEYFSNEIQIINQERDRFKPLDNVTKAEFFKLMVGSAGYFPDLSQTYETSFQDVPSTEWYAPYVQKALELNTITSENTNFNAGDYVSRLQGLELIFKFYGIEIPDYIIENPSYLDVSKDDPYAGLSQKAFDLELLHDFKSLNFQPDMLLTRAETVHILFKLQLNSTAYPFILYENQVESLQNTINNIDSDISAEETFLIFLDVWEKIANEYVDKENINSDELIYGAISGMVNELDDPYSSFYKPIESLNFLDSLEGVFDGIGVYLEEDNGNVVIITPLKGSPAEKAGILPGDIILEIDDTQIANLDLNEVVNMLRGQSGTSVKLKIKRNTSTFIKSIVRSSITVPYVESEIIDGVGVIYYNQFTTSSHQQLLTEIDKLKAQNPRGLILDLRNNPGGYLSSSNLLISHFIPRGEIFLNIEFGNGFTKNEIGVGPGDLVDYPLVILINEGTASASEIVAMGLRDLRNIKIVGTQSFGKGKIQEIISYYDGSTLKLSTARWISPNGHDIDEKGINPDIVVELTQNDILTDNDRQLKKALELIP